MTIKTSDYLEENYSRFLDQLQQWLAIPSISTLSEHKGDVLKAAEWVTERLSAFGFAEAKIIPTKG